MNLHFINPRALRLGLLWVTASGPLVPVAGAQDTPPTKQAIVELNKALVLAKEGDSEALQRLAVRRVIRDAEQLVEAHQDDPSRFPVLEFIFRAQQQLIALDKDAKHRVALLDTCRVLVKAPDEYAELRLDADLLLSQAELAKQGANGEVSANALRPFVERYLAPPAGAKVLRLAMVMALELGDNGLVDDLREMIARRFPADLEIITFQRDKLGGQVFGAPFTGTFERSDGKMARFPMDGLGILSEDDQINNVLIGQDGRIAVAISGLAMQSSRSGTTLINVIVREDEKSISSALEHGEVEAAKERILALAPPFDPEAVEDRGRKLKQPRYSIAHLRARAKVYMALKQWDKALADAEEVVQEQSGTDGGMSLRTDELDESEALRDSILGIREEAKK